MKVTELTAPASKTATATVSPAKPLASARAVAKASGMPKKAAEAAGTPKKAAEAAGTPKKAAEAAGTAPEKPATEKQAGPSSLEQKPSSPEHKLAPKELKEREEKIKKVQEQVLRKFGDGSIMTLGVDHTRQVPSISTGCTSLDLALGCGGIPRGRIVEIYGPESSGKTTLTLHLVAQAQNAGGVAAFIDAEHAIDPGYARKLGVDLDHLLVSQPDSGEQALEIAEMLTASGGVDIVVIDSVAALVPRAELAGEMGDTHVGLQARLMSQAMRKLTAVAHKNATVLVFINQIREKIGVMFGSPETTSGGRALKFYASVRMDIRRIGTIKSGDEVVGNRTRVKVVKNKMAAPFRQAEFDIIYNKGISFVGDLLDLATTHRVTTKSGTWYSFGNTRLGQGRERAVRFLEENPDLCEEMQRKTLAAEVASRTAKKK